MTEQIKVLIADDDQVLASMLKEYLETESCTVRCAGNGLEALDAVAAEPFDILVLDIMMPGLNGLETLKKLRLQRSLPVIMLTARGDDLDRILGLELGADDYLPKPCNPRELLARIRAVLRRSSGPMESVLEPLRQGDLYLNPGMREVLINQQDQITLTQTEFDLLHLIVSRPNQVVSRSEMSLNVLDKPLEQWDRSIDVHISNLRRKLGPHPDGKERIRTLRGSGYLYAIAQAKQ